MPKFNLTLDSSQIYEFQTCPLKWYYKYKENLRLSNLAQKIAADKGTLVHHLSELYYTQRALLPNGNALLQLNDAIETFKTTKVTKDLFPDDDGTLESFICQRFALYVQRYLNEDFQVQVGANGDAGVEIGFSNLLFENDEVRFVLEGRLDLLIKLANGELAWVDHKTQEKTSDLYSYKTQFRTYALATGFNYGIINYIGMQQDKNNELLRNNKLFRRSLIHFPKEMIQEWKFKIITIFEKIYTGLTNENPEKYFYESKNESACAGAFDSWPCEYSAICEEFNWDFKNKVKDFKYTKVKPWSPWSPKLI